MRERFFPRDMEMTEHWTGEIITVCLSHILTAREVEGEDITCMPHGICTLEQCEQPETARDRLLLYQEGEVLHVT